MKIGGIATLAGLLAVVVSVVGVATNTYAAGNTCTWTGAGGDSYFSTAANWSGCTPTDGDDLIFPAAESASVYINNDSLTSLGSVTLNSSSNTSNYYTTTIASSSDTTLLGSINVGTNQALSFNDTGSSGYILGGDVNVTLDTKGRISMYSDLSMGSNGLSIARSQSVNLSHVSDLSAVLLSGFGSALTGNSDASITLNGIGTDLSYAGDLSGYAGNIVAYDSVISFDSWLDLNANTRLLLHDSALDYGDTVPYNLTTPVEFTGNFLGGRSDTFGYEAVMNPSSALTLSNTTLHSDIQVDPFSANITFAGSLVGRYLIGGSQAYSPSATTGHIIISASTNTSLLPNDDYIIVNQGSYSDSTAQSIIVQSGDAVTINGARGRVIVSPTATLFGTGTVGDLSVLGTAHLSPGHSPGCMSTGSLALSAGAIYDVDLGGTVVCTGYDQVRVTGTVSLADAILALNFYGGYIPANGTSFTVITNDGSDAVVGEFAGLPEGTKFVYNNKAFQITYKGGDGNDVVITTVGGAGVPNTGFEMLTSSPVLIAAGTLLAAGAVLVASKQVRFARSK